jgi:type VI secretion system secreted protein Hcp
MAYEFYVTIQGSKQGTFKGDSRGVEGPARGKATKNGKHDKIPGIRFFFETSSPRDLATGQASGKRQHKPILITKEWDAASPQLFSALVSNEVLKSVLFEFVKTNAQGEFVYHTVKLTNATVSEIKAYLDLTDTTGDPYDAHELEDVSFTFEKIEIENKEGKTAAVDDWQA